MKHKFKKHIYQTSSIAGVCEPPVKSPSKTYNYIKVRIDDSVFYYNKAGVLSTSFDDASALEKKIAMKAAQLISKNYPFTDVFTSTVEPSQAIVSFIEECKLANLSRRFYN